VKITNYEASHYATFAILLFLPLSNIQIFSSSHYSLAASIFSFLHPEHLLYHRTDLIAVATFFWRAWENKKGLHFVEERGRLINNVPRTIAVT
jgi:hypothetical protein